MTTARRNHLTTDHIRSPYIFERRRKLFPVEDQDVDSELGHISPIRSDDSSDSETEQCDVRGDETPIAHRTHSETISPLKLSPYTVPQLSPSQSLKTPHDTSTKPVLEKEQKTLLEESKSLKRKASPYDCNSPDHKSFKSSRVRTALFPVENGFDMALPTKSFYSQHLHQENVMDKLSAHKGIFHYNKPVKFSTAKHGYRIRKARGQINNGVRHKIRKPKQKMLPKDVIARATKSMLETGSALNEYIKDLSELKNKQAPRKLIEPPEDHSLAGYLSDVKKLQTSQMRKQISTPPRQVVEKNKENLMPSPSSGEAKKTRKFFKASRLKKESNKPNANVNDVIEDDAKTFKIPPVESPKTARLTLENSLNDFDEDDSEPQANIDSILSSLAPDSPLKDTQPNNANVFRLTTASFPQVQSNEVVFAPKIVLEAHGSIAASENSVQLHRPNVANMILSPISQMCDVTSGLALNSPGKGRNVTSLPNVSRASKMLSFNGDCHSTAMDGPRDGKLFPVFYKGAAAQSERGEKRERGDSAKKSVKKFKALPPDQMLLDAGQKRFGLTMCNECNIVYHMGDPNDEIQHMNYHNAQNVLRFTGWKNEHLVADFHTNGRIIRVMPTDSKIWLRKVKDLMEVVVKDLGCYEMECNISQSQVYLYIKSRTIAGCAVATVPKGRGHRMLSSLSGVAMCSEESYPIKCGVSYVWVAPNFRKLGVASALLDAVKSNFAFGSALSNDDIALTSPTEAGSAFAEKYFRTPNYLIYYT